MQFIVFCLENFVWEAWKIIIQHNPITLFYYNQQRFNFTVVNEYVNDDDDDDGIICI